MNRYVINWQSDSRVSVSVVPAKNINKAIFYFFKKYPNAKVLKTKNTGFINYYNAKDLLNGFLGQSK